MNKQKSISWIVMFLLFIIAPTLVRFIIGDNLDGTNYENRELASVPIISKDNYENFPMEFEKYYNDNLPFRNELINLNSIISYHIFKDSSNEQVLLGKDEWLFYMGGAVQTSSGQVQWTEQEMERITENMSEAQRYLKHEGTELVIFIAPNKESVYKELLPDNYPIISEKTNGEKLAEYLKDNTELNVIYPLNELRNIRTKYETYLQFDTHWNNLGAYIGAKLINKQVGIRMPELDELNIVEIPETRGDLTRMLHLSFEGRGTNYDFEEYDDGLNEFQDSKYWECHNDEGDERVVLVKKDSFGVRLSSYLASEFQDVYFVSDDTEKYIKELRPDIVIIEMVERNCAVMGLKLNFVETEINCEGDKKEVLFYATTENPLEFVSVFKSKSGSNEVEVIQVLQPMNEMKIDVPIDESGEFYVYIFEDAEGKNVLKEMVVQY